MGCGCGSGGAAGASGDRYVNVKADGTPTRVMSKAEATASAQVNGGYIRQA